MRRKSKNTNTHPKFKTIEPYAYYNGEDIDNIAGNAFWQQYTLLKTTTQVERIKYWGDRDLRRIEINVRDIDRLYYIFHRYGPGYGDEKFRIIARMELNKGNRRKRRSKRRRRFDEPEQQLPLLPLPRHVYFELSARSSYEYNRSTMVSERKTRGVVFISQDANLFMNVVLDKECLKYKHLIYQSLAEDNILVADQHHPLIEYNYQKHHNLHYRDQDSKRDGERERCCGRYNPQSLKYLCHMTVYYNKMLLRDYINKLPKILFASVNCFNGIEEARSEYKRNKALFS